MSRFRILSLDGGGIKGAFTASVMATLEEDTGKVAAEYFDLITGTSTGGVPAKVIREFYAMRSPMIAVSSRFLNDEKAPTFVPCHPL